MKIEHVEINNWKPPGDRWWKEIESKPDEPLIEATITMTLSYREYNKLLVGSKARVSEVKE